MNKTAEFINSKSLKVKYQAKKTETDESLFGIKPTSTGEELNKVKVMAKSGNYNHPDLVVFPEQEILHTKNHATVKSKEEQIHGKKMLKEQRQQQLEMGRAKK